MPPVPHVNPLLKLSMSNFSRREMLKRGAALASSSSAACAWAQAATDGPYADPALIEKWLEPLFAAPAASQGALHLGRFKDRMYYLDKEISWKPGPGQAGPEVVVPVGFVTDLTSVPRIFWSLLPTDGIYTFPAIIHDYMYWTQKHSKTTADSVFRFSMDDMKVSSAVAATIHLAVSKAGQGAWDENARLKQRGERRLLVKFPTDPTTTWAEWKAKSDCCSAL